MVSFFSLRTLATLAAAVATLAGVSASPMFDNPKFLVPSKGVASSNATAHLSARATQAAPRFVVYQDAWVSGETGPPPVSQINGFNVL
jgi:chitinase